MPAGRLEVLEAGEIAVVAAQHEVEIGVLRVSGESSLEALWARIVQGDSEREGAVADAPGDGEEGGQEEEEEEAVCYPADGGLIEYVLHGWRGSALRARYLSAPHR